jgi:hypothetical protein
MTRRTIISAWLLAALLSLVFFAVLITPSGEAGRPFSSYSAGSQGLRLSHDLIDRLGWTAEAREVPFSDTLTDPAPIQMVVNASISDQEAGALLAFARRGGSLLIAGRNANISDSLGLVSVGNGKLAEVPSTPNCESRGTWQSELTQVAYGSAIGADRPLPDDTVGFGAVELERKGEKAARLGRAAIGMPYDSGRIVVIAEASFLTNDVIRRCELEADVEYVRMIEYLSGDRRHLRVAFDEYHHGYGARGGSLAAIRMYLSGTPSGHMLAQIAVGGLLLLLAVAPRPLAPRDPTHVARRSPLEHADALAHAYKGVGATKTATERLLAGVRRRVRRRAGARDTDRAFLAAAGSLSPAAGQAARVVGNALENRIPERQLPEVAAARETIERELTRPTPSHR